MDNPFNRDTFFQKFKPAFNSYKIDVGAFEFAELMLSQSVDERIKGFFGLMGYPKSRMSRITCHLLIENIFHHDIQIRQLVSDALSRYLIHPEIGFNPPPPPGEIRSYVEKFISSFGVIEVVKLLELALIDEENLIERGSIGQSIGVIIVAIPKHEDYLFQIVTNYSLSDEVRRAALFLISLFMMHSAIKDVLKSPYKFDLAGIYEEFTWIAQEALEDELQEANLLDMIDQMGYDDHRIATVLQDASIFFLAEYESVLFNIMGETKNAYVRTEVGHALNRLMNWRCPPGQHMKGLFD